ncbi:MAG: Trm112 family protein [Henriciella sp.]|nr:Trm112 family protein [Henriciella sp.]
MTEDTHAAKTGPCGVDPRLLELLICPVTRGPLKLDAEACELISTKAKLAYPIRNGMPIMLDSEARDLDLDPT